jgi:TPR repeat protein
MTLVTIRIFLLIAFLASLSFGDGDFEAGKKAYEGRDYKNALNLFSKTAEKGDPHSQCALGLMYGHGHGVPQDYKTAVQLYIKSANQGYPKAQYNLGVMYYMGYGVPHNETTAAYWYTKAAKQGYTLAQNNLGDMYREGHGVTKNRPIAYALLGLAGTGNDENAKEDQEELTKELSAQELKEGKELLANPKKLWGLIDQMQTK